MVTIYDVAAASGFSPATVSKALNSYHGVNKNTVHRIMNTAKELGYMPNIAARSLTTKKSWLVGMLFSEELQSGLKHPHSGEIFSSAQIHLGKAGYDVVVLNNSLGSENISYFEHCHYRGVEGVFMAASSQFTQTIQCIVESDLKMVSVEMPYPGRYSVISENYKGSTLAMEHLYDLGHRKIAYIAGPLDRLSAKERYQGYIDFLAEKSLPLDHGLVVESAGYTALDGYDAALRLLKTGKGRFTAVFADYDDIACAAINCFRANGLVIPEEVSVIGFDDLSIADISGLTTIRQDREKIGCMAADILIAQMQGLPVEYSHDVRVATSLVVRKSCRRIEN